MAPAIAPVSASRVVGSPMLGGPSGVRAAAAPAPASLTLTQNLFGRPLKPKMIAQRMAGVLGAETAAALQDRHDMIDERLELMRQCRSHKRESVDGTCVLPSDHMSGQLLGRADEIHPPRATGHLLGDLT